jgi:hypothetical protein
MTIDEAIKSLKEAKKQGKTNVIVAWWDNEAFGFQEDDKWAGICDFVDDKMDWSGAHDDISYFINDYLKNIYK